MSTVNHNKAISIGKAICIILMVIGHSGCPTLLRNWIYTFHMPFFFFVSGYLFNNKSLDSFIPFAKKKMRGLWLPFVKWNILFILLHNLFYKLGFLNTEYSITDFLNKIVVSLYMGEPQLLLGTFWFLQQLIRVNIIAWLLLKTINYFCNKNNVSYNSTILLTNISIVILSIAAYGLDFRIPGVISKLTIISLLFYFSGYTLKLYESRIHTYIHTYIQSKYFFFFSMILTFIGGIFYPFEMLTLTTNAVLPYWIIAIFGCLMIYNISIRISTINYLSNTIDYIGSNTLIIMVLHLLTFKFTSLLLVSFNIISQDSLLAWPVPSIAKDGLWILYSIAGVCIPLIIDAILKRVREIVITLINRKQTNLMS